MNLNVLRIMGLSLVFAWANSSDAIMVNQYIFNDGTANDSIGGAHGTLVGTASVGGFGLLNTTGGGSGNSYLDLPNGVASSAVDGGTSGAFSFEVWAQANTLANWASLVSIGGATGQEDSTDGPNKDYIQVIPQNGNNGLLRATTHAVGNGTEGLVDGAAALSTSSSQHIVVVVDQSGGVPGTIDLYVDNINAGQAAIADGLDISNMDDNNNWLGRSQWGDDSFDGAFDEFRIYDHALNATEVEDSFIEGPVPPPVIPLTPTLMIDRDSGDMVLQGGQSVSQVVGYSIQSAFGSLEPANWTPITDNLDAPTPGDGTFDDDDQWSILSANGSHTDFSEFEFDGGDGGELGIGELLPLSGEDAWIQSTTEDVVMNLKLDNGTTVPVDVIFDSTSGTPFTRSDLNFDGALNELDWPIFRDNHEADLTGLSLAQAYGLGDLDADGDNDYQDFLLFQIDFDAIAGAGALAALISSSSIPEPSTTMLLLGVLLPVSLRRNSLRLLS